MIFPSDNEMRQYATYYIRALGIFKEEFKNNQGRPPTEFELQDFAKMGIIPFGFIPRTNSNSSTSSQGNETGQKQVQSEYNKGKAQSSQGEGKQTKMDWKSEVLRLLNEFPQNLERKSQSKIVITKEIPRSEWDSVRKTFEREGWKYDWNDKSFLLSSEGAKA